MTVQLVLKGHVPSKKNLYRRGRSGQLFLDKEVKAQIDALVVQARSEWCRAWIGPPVRHPDIDVTFFVRNRLGDRDNKWATISDVLEKAGVISRDNIAQFNGTLVIHPAVVAGEERTVVKIKIYQDSLYGKDGLVHAQSTT